MNLSGEAMLVLQKAIEFAAEKGYEYVTPEMILLMILKIPEFVAAYENCGGDKKALKKRLKKYIEKYVEKSNGNEPTLSTGTQHMINFAGQSAFGSGCDQIYIRHFIHAIWNLDNSYGIDLTHVTDTK